MILSWTRRMGAAYRANKNKPSGDNLEVEIVTPAHFRCPISLDLMKDAVTICTGITYDRESIERWIEQGNKTCPVTNQVLKNFDLIPNHALRRMIQDWCVENQSHGIERIPTPRVPVSPYEVSETCSRIVVATQRGDQKKCQDLLGKIKNWGKESERNKRCIVESGSGSVLSASFESFANISMETHEDLLREILSALAWMFPFGVEAQYKLGSAVSLRCILWFLTSGDLSARQNAVLVLRELLSLDQKHANSVVEIDGFVEALINMIREPICPAATKASLMAIYHMISPSMKSETIICSFVEMGLVSLLLEIAFDAEKSACEKALGVLDRICNANRGREEVCKNAMTMPILVKKILRVSDLATELSVSIMWKLCKNEKRGHEDCLTVALQGGAFQKLLVLLQVGCGESTKVKVTGLMKLLNAQKNISNCSDSSMDFKYLKRPF